MERREQAIAILDRVNRQREEPDTQWKAAACVRWRASDDVRFCEGLGLRNSLGLLGKRVISSASKPLPLFIQLRTYRCIALADAMANYREVLPDPEAPYQ